MTDRKTARRRGLVLGGLATLALALAPSVPSAAEPWKLGSAAQPGSPLITFADSFVGAVNRAGVGIAVERQFVGSEQELTNQVVRGRLQMAQVSFAGSSVVVGELATFNVPYLWSSPEERDWVMEKVGLELATRLYAEKGLVMVGAYDTRYSGLLCKIDCRKPESLKGVKARVAPTAASRLFWRQVGANGVQMSLADLFPALQQGVVEAADLAFIYYVTTPAAQTNPYFVDTQHLHHHGAFIVNRVAFDKLSPAAQQALRAARPSLPASRAINIAAEVELIAKFRAGGGHYYPVSAAESEEWRKLVVPSQGDVVKEIGGRAQEVFDALMKGKADYAARPK